MKKPSKKVLKNGVTTIVIPKQGLTTTVLIGVRVGSNHESKNELGLAHFFEHMCFKGTKSYPTPKELVTKLDSLGASVNACTSNEFTAYHITGSADQLYTLLDFTADLYLNPIFPKEELEKERGVILQEHAMYEDMPRSKVIKIGEELLFNGTVAARPVIGTKKSIKSLTHEQFLSFRKEHYVGRNTVISVVGDCDANKVHKHVASLFSSLKGGSKVSSPKISPKSSKASQIKKQDIDQISVMIGFPIVPDRKEFAAFEVLTTILGRGFSSRLFIRVREEMGACYSIHAGFYPSSNYGMFSVNTGTNAKNLSKVVEAIGEEVALLKNKLVDKEELQKAKNYLIGEISREYEVSNDIAFSFFGNYVVHGLLETPEKFINEVKKVTSDDIKKIAKKYFKQNKVKISAVGPVKETPANLVKQFRV